ncbi:MAG: 50S ribosomal protein L3 N(5)-glutamine methyltransferase [Wenzhouxiangellaceae bacterium]|nr:50S ribosomal protein L3 N(5)-glutamine methyltransferase [Wenzhouxiangellaceae bacterium]
MSANCSESARAAPAAWVRDAARRMDAAGLVFGHGTACAHDEACWMLSQVLSLPPDFDDSQLPARLSVEQLRALETLLGERIETRRPLAYLIGEAWFAGLRFAVDESTLVPRSPLAEVARDGLAPWLDFERPLSVLEIGTGSGCIAAALAHYWPKLSIEATDISRSALDLAAGNLDALGLAGRVRLVESDVFDALTGRRFDLIISNPPYVPDASMQVLPAEYRHEPATALAAGEDGLAIFRRLLAGAPEHLKADGWLLVELGEAAPAAEALLGEVEHLWLEFEHGGDGVVLLDRAACEQCGKVL